MSADEHLTPTSELCLPGSLGPTSARLARALKLLDDMREELRVLRDAVPCGWCSGLGVAPAERFGRDPDGAPMVEEDQPCPEGCELPAWLVVERNEARDVERERDALSDELTSARAELALIRRQNTTLRADLDRARNRADAAERARSWVVARDGGRWCERCEGEVTRGQAYELEPGTGGLVHHIRCPDIEEKSMTTSGIVCIVTPTIMDGTVVRWYRSETAAETNKVMVSASRNGIRVGEHLTNGEVPAEVMALAAQAWTVLSADHGADMSSWATHRRERVLGSSIVPVRREASDG